jgi:hypothetical protein
MNFFATSSTHHRPLANAVCLVVGGIGISPPLHPQPEGVGLSDESW